MRGSSYWIGSPALRAAVGAREVEEARVERRGHAWLAGNPLEQRSYDLGQRVTKRRVLVGVKVHAVHHAGASHLCGVKERTLLLGRDLLVGLSKTDASADGARQAV